MTGVVPETTPDHPRSPDPSTSEPATYASAGVDIEAGDRAVELIRSLVASTNRPEVVGELGAFGGLFSVPVDRYRAPVLVASTDGVGTKAEIARMLGRFDTIGIDLVAMCVDDLVCQGAEPLFVLDYISSASIDPSRMAELVSGVAEGCRRVGAALLGGEMAEHAGLMESDQFELVGFAVGVVERDGILGPERVRAGDALIGLASPGLRSNGYTLGRRVLLERAGLALDGPAWPGARASLADELLRPSVLYTPAVRRAIESSEVHAVAHVTGGGIPGNLPRALPLGLRAVVDASTWQVPQIFSEIRRLGPVVDNEMVRVFNVGLGMIVVVAPERAEDALEVFRGLGVDAMAVGRVEEGDRGVDLVGELRWTAAEGSGR
ncbi:MAG: phosphoribosylformylglycinamidine cyclo-ligase [Acidimicrobiales bacterium]